MLQSRRYSLLGQLGEGGMGQVFRALDHLTGRTVALKRLSPRATASCAMRHTVSAERALSGADHSRQRQQGLAREFRLLTTLHHPHIIRVFDYGYDDQRQPYYTMELLDEARPLLPLASPTPQAAKLELLRQLLRALRYLHQRGVVHRDLQPGNLLVTAAGTRLHVTLIDFGLALHRREAQAGPAAGTFAYLSPELRAGAAASEASDVYALGVLAYELLTGQSPHEAQRAAEGVVRLTGWQSWHYEPDLSLLPPRLRPILGPTLSRLPQQRPDAAALLREISRLMQDDDADHPAEH